MRRPFLDKVDNSVVIYLGFDVQVVSFCMCTVKPERQRICFASTLFKNFSGCAYILQRNYEIESAHNFQHISSPY